MQHGVSVRQSVCVLVLSIGQELIPCKMAKPNRLKCHLGCELWHPRNHALSGGRILDPPLEEALFGKGNT